MVIRFTVWVPISFEEIPGAQLLIAVRANEVLRMPRLSQGGDHLTYNWLVTRTTATLLRRVYTLSIHICLQTTKHRIQLCCLILLALQTLVRSVRQVVGYVASPLLRNLDRPRDIANNNLLETKNHSETLSVECI